MLTWPSNTVTLTGTISDDSVPSNRLWAQWSKFSGPGIVILSQTSITATNPGSGTWNLELPTTATFSQPGTYALRLIGSDFALTNGADVVVRVVLPNPPNQPPVVDAGPDQTIVVTNTLTLAGSVSDDGNPNGSVLSAFWAKVSGPGPVYFGSFTNLTTNVVTSVRFPIPGQYVLRLSASDSAVNATDDVTITVLTLDPNLAPVVSAGPDFTVPQYAHQALAASVSDDGLPSGFMAVGWSVVSGPGRGYFDDAAAVNTPVTFYLTGTYVLRLTATDGHVSAFDDVTVTVVPPVNDGPIADAGGDLTVVRPNAALLLGAVYDDGLPFGYPLTYQWSKVSGPGTVTFLVAPEPGGGGVTVSNTTQNVTHWENVDGIDAFAFATFSTNGEYVLSLTATDTEFTNTDTVTITVLPGTNSPPVVNAGPDFIVALPDQAVLVSDVTDDGLEQGWIEMSWTAVSGPGPVWFSTLNGTYRATFIAPGEYVLRLTAHDGSLTNHDDVTVTVYDTPPPTAEIQSPLDGAIITSPTNVIGTASSDLLQSYVLEYRLKPAESDSPRLVLVLALTTWSVLDQQHGFNRQQRARPTRPDAFAERHLRTAPHRHGPHRPLRHDRSDHRDLRSQPEDRAVHDLVQRPGRAGARPAVAGHAHLRQPRRRRGNSRRLRHRLDDGPSQRAPAEEPFARAQLGPDDDRQSVRPVAGVSSQSDQPTHRDDHVPGWARGKIPVRSEAGRSAAAADRLSAMALHAAGQHARHAGAGGLRRSGRKLPVLLRSDSGHSRPGGPELLLRRVDVGNCRTRNCRSALEHYPTLFRYTSPEGYKYLIDENDGLQSVTDPNGNTLVVSTNGLTWSNPNAGTNSLNIVFQRDAQGRITNIVDAAGHAMSYRYDAIGNLATYVNRDGNTNAFTYDATHRLVTLTDARGVQVLGNQYDSAGRLVGSADAAGHAMTYGHDLDQRRDYVTNRLGFVTINEYDDHGNIIRITDPLGAVSSFVYDDNGNLLVKSNATDCHCSISYTYDADRQSRQRNRRAGEYDALHLQSVAKNPDDHGAVRLCDDEYVRRRRQSAIDARRCRSGGNVHLQQSWQSDVDDDARAHHVV